MPIDSAIFAEQKSNKMCSASAHTDTRPCRVWQNEVSLEKSGARWQQCLRNDCARSGDSEALSPIAQKEPTGCKKSAAK
ncbi:hypothetical protein, partial [uncultured Helicobacter sp.]|uniref:hypothetical protein n=1 Tax=uncultured Helicobacter sp. TaxID=175537 RepID=UPI0037512FCB